MTAADHEAARKLAEQIIRSEGVKLSLDGSQIVCRAYLDLAKTGKVVTYDQMDEPSEVIVRKDRDAWPDYSISPTSAEATPVEVQEKPTPEQTRALDWICSIIEREAQFWIDDAGKVHVNNAPMVAYKIVTDSVAVQLVRKLGVG